MKTREQHQAAILRKGGKSMGEIATILGVAKSSVSCWVRDVVLTKKQRAQLNKNGHSVNAIEKRRIARVANTRIRRKEIMLAAASEVSALSQNMLWCVGVSLYWGEGGKTQQTARLSNSDPAVIRTIMRFFREYGEMTEEKFRGQIHTFSHQNVQKTEIYWSEVSGVPISNFYKTYVKKSSASKNKRNTLPYGTFQIYVHDTKFFFRLMGWLEKVKEMQLKNI